MTGQQLRHIVVPIDFSPHSGAAVRWAAYWQEQTGAQVTVLHCRQFEAPPTFTLDQVDALAQQAARSEAEISKEVAAFVEQQVGHAVAWDIRVQEGDPVQLILEQCDCADLVIMGTHGRHGLQRWMLGSVAESMLHAAKSPVLVVHQAAEPPHLSRILVAINHTERDAMALHTAAEVAATFRADLFTVHVVEAHAQHAEHAPVPTSVNNLPLQHIERSGKPAEQLLTTAGELGADLVVMSVTPKRFLEIAILPPTITQVLQFGAVPVLVLPTAVTAKGGQS